MENKDKLKSVDEALERCEKSIDSHKREANRLFRIILVVLAFFAVIQVSGFLMQVHNASILTSYAEDLQSTSKLISRSLKIAIINRDLRADSTVLADSVTVNVQRLKAIPDKLGVATIFKIDNTTVYIFYGIFILVFGVLTSFYRYHLKEIAKYEHFLFGFERIRIAGNNSTTGFEDLVKISLTKDAFSHELKKESKGGSAPVESPIPGHPSSDLATLLLNKLISTVDIIPKKKSTDEV